MDCLKVPEWSASVSEEYKKSVGGYNESVRGVGLKVPGCTRALEEYERLMEKNVTGSEEHNESVGEMQ